MLLRNKMLQSSEQKSHKNSRKRDSSTNVQANPPSSESEINSELISIAKTVSDKHNQSGSSDSDFSLASPQKSGQSSGTKGTPRQRSGRGGGTMDVQMTPEQTRLPAMPSLKPLTVTGGDSFPMPPPGGSSVKKKRKSHVNFDPGASHDAVDPQSEVGWKEDSQFWLIQVPVDMDVSDLDGVTCDMKSGVSVSYDDQHPQSSLWEGFNMSVRKKSKKDQLSTCSALLPDENQHLKPVGRCAGQINVTKCVKVPVNHDLLVKPWQRPRIPEGLKHRAVAFGGDGPVILQRKEVTVKKEKKTKKKKKKHKKES